MSLLQSLRPGGRHGIAATETRDPIGYAVAALSRLAQSDVLDRLGLRKQTEAAVYTATRGGFRTITTRRPDVRQGRQEGESRHPAGRRGRARASST